MMKIRHPALIRAIGIAGSRVVSRLGATLDYHFRYADPAVNPALAEHYGKRYIYAFFHEVMLFPAYYWSRPQMRILISEHSDGEMITQVVKRLGFGVIRGSSTRGGARALRTMLHECEEGNPCFTPDGPRGPRRVVQPGMIYLAGRTGLPIAAAGMAFRRPFRAKSWDRFAVPKPFTPAACVIPKPILVPPDADRDTLEDYRREVQLRMVQATEDAEAWVERL